MLSSQEFTVDKYSLRRIWTLCAVSQSFTMMLFGHELKYSMNYYSVVTKITYFVENSIILLYLCSNLMITVVHEKDSCC